MVDLVLYGGLAIGAIIIIVIWSKINRRRQIQDQVRRVKEANAPDYQAPDDGMEAFIEDGVIKYRRRRGRK